MAFWESDSLFPIAVALAQQPVLGTPAFTTAAAVRDVQSRHKVSASRSKTQLRTFLATATAFWFNYRQHPRARRASADH